MKAVTAKRNNKKRPNLKRSSILKREVKGETLRVHLRDNCEPDYEWVNLRKKIGDQIRWVSRSEQFTIHFEDTPFADKQGNKKYNFVVPAGGHVDSGPPVFGDKEQDYEYTISCAALAMSADPGLSVKE
jgi:hypothetical protein